MTSGPSHGQVPDPQHPPGDRGEASPRRSRSGSARRSARSAPPGRHAPPDGRAVPRDRSAPRDRTRSGRRPPIPRSRTNASGSVNACSSWLAESREGRTNRSAGIVVPAISTSLGRHAPGLRERAAQPQHLLDRGRDRRRVLARSTVQVSRPSARGWSSKGPDRVAEQHRRRDVAGEQQQEREVGGLLVVEQHRRAVGDHLGGDERGDQVVPGGAVGDGGATLLHRVDQVGADVGHRRRDARPPARGRSGRRPASRTAGRPTRGRCRGRRRAAPASRRSRSPAAGTRGRRRGRTRRSPRRRAGCG